MEFIMFAITQDWLVLLPILACSIATVGVAIERFFFYQKNKRDVVQFVTRLQRELAKGNLETAKNLSAQVGGIIGEVSEEGLRVLEEQKESFDRSFDITTALATRKLLKFLSVLATIATITPYLGLFATVVRILLTFGEMANGSASAAGAPQVMAGIGSALIATAFGLLIAIVSVTLNNYFQSIVSRYEDDFQLLKLLFLSFVDGRNATAMNAAYEQRRATAGVERPAY